MCRGIRLKPNTVQHLSFCVQSKNHKHRIPFMQREKAAYQILRKNGLSYNTIAEGFGRSVSVVYHAVKRAVDITHYFGWNIQDLRKLPRRRRIINASRNRYFMLKLRAAWEQWVCGEGEEPP